MIRPFIDMVVAWEASKVAESKGATDAIPPCSWGELIELRPDLASLPNMEGTFEVTQGGYLRRVVGE